MESFLRAPSPFYCWSSAVEQQGAERETLHLHGPQSSPLKETLPFLQSFWIGGIGLVFGSSMPVRIPGSRAAFKGI